MLRFRWFVNDFKDALARGASGLNQLIKLMQFAYRFVEKTAEYKKGGEIAQIGRSCQDLTRPNHDD